MQASEPDRDPMAQVLTLSPGGDATQLELTAAEGYLLSRIDGVTPWRLLREMGGVPAEEVDVCLARWVEAGLLEVLGAASPPTPDEAVADSSATDAASAASVVGPASPIDEAVLDEDLELDLSVQRRILEFEACLGLPYCEILGVASNAQPKIVKRAYFKLSREFHPDRYFRREIGEYTARLERIFKKVLEAYEILSDPELCRVENQPEPEAVEPAQKPRMDAGAAPTAESKAQEQKSPPPRPLTKLERLRQRMPFKINHAVLADRRAKASEIFRAACVSQRTGRLKEAEASLRIAISFDPLRTEFKEALGSLRLEAAGERAAKLLAASSERMQDSDLRETLALLEDVLIYRPHDPELNERAARVCLQLKKFDDARDCAQRLIDRSPEIAAHHTLLGLIYRGQENLDAAMSEFETALKCDAGDLDAKRGLAAIRIRRHDAALRGD